MDHIGALQPDKRNARRHSPRGVGMIETSLQKRGFGRSVLISADNKIIAGHATIEAAGNVGIEDMVVVPSDGTKVVAVQRTDIVSGTEAFHGLGLDDNRSGEFSDWEPEPLAALYDDFPELQADHFRDDELADVLAIVPDFAPVGIEEQGRLDEKATTTCPECGHVFTP